LPPPAGLAERLNGGQTPAPCFRGFRPLVGRTGLLRLPSHFRHCGAGCLPFRGRGGLLWPGLAATVAAMQHRHRLGRTQRALLCGFSLLPFFLCFTCLPALPLTAASPLHTCVPHTHIYTAHYLPLHTCRTALPSYRLSGAVYAYYFTLHRSLGLAVHAGDGRFVFLPSFHCLSFLNTRANALATLGTLPLRAVGGLGATRRQYCGLVLPYTCVPARWLKACLAAERYLRTWAGERLALPPCRRLVCIPPRWETAERHLGSLFPALLPSCVLTPVLGSCAVRLPRIVPCTATVLLAPFVTTYCSTLPERFFLPGDINLRFLARERAGRQSCGRGMFTATGPFPEDVHSNSSAIPARATDRVRRVPHPPVPRLSERQARRILTTLHRRTFSPSLRNIRRMENAAAWYKIFAYNSYAHGTQTWVASGRTAFCIRAGPPVLPVFHAAGNILSSGSVDVCRVPEPVACYLALTRCCRLLRGDGGAMTVGRRGRRACCGDTVPCCARNNGSPFSA